MPREHHQRPRRHRLARVHKDERSPIQGKESGGRRADLEPWYGGIKGAGLQRGHRLAVVASIEIIVKYRRDNAANPHFVFADLGVTHRHHHHSQFHYRIRPSSPLESNRRR